MSATDELRAAADKLRTLAARASDGPWETTWRGQQYHLDGYRDGDLHPITEWTYAIATWEPQATEQRAECDTTDSDYIATMHPGVGAGLADWLTTEANTWAGDEVHNRCSSHTCTLDAALAVARAINGSA